MAKFFLTGIVPLFLGTSSLFAAPRLHPLFSDHAVLQRNTPVPVWGWSEPGEAIVVTCAGQARSATADTRGNWRVTLAPMAAGGPYDLVVEGKGRQVANDILFGDVWLCGGQSNMEYGMDHVINAKDELAAADYPQIRMFMPAPYGRDNTPQEYLVGAWAPIKPNQVPGSAVGYFFARDIFQSQKVPIGTIHCAVGATGISTWMSRAALAAFPELADELAATDRLCEDYSDQHRAMVQAWEERSKEARTTGQASPLPPPPPDGDPRRQDFRRPTFLYNGIVAPLSRFPICGVIFYQGESDANPEMAPRYGRMFPALIADWRRAFGREDLPFFYVQLANHRRTAWEALCEVREAQRQALAVPHTGMAVAIDVGDVGDVHCKNKQEIARRLALIARAKVYNEKLEHSGPVADAVTFAGQQVQVTFTHAEGLRFTEGKALGFEVAGGDGVYHVASGEIQENKLVVSSPDVSEPTAIRYAWRDTPEVSLSNSAGLPASPFRAQKSASNPQASSFFKK